MPIQRQLVDKFAEAIVSLKLMPGQFLPSTRELAKMLNISRATAVRGYEDLIAQGYIETVGGSATFVRKRIVGRAAEQNEPSNFSLSAFAQHVMQIKPEKLTAHDFPKLNYGCAPSDCLPLLPWKQALFDAWRQLDSTGIDYGNDPFGYQPLRQVLCAYLSRSRMIDCLADHLVISASSTYLLSLIAELIIDPGDAVVFPEPGASYARDTFNSLGAQLLPIAVDKDGIDVEQIIMLEQVPKLVYVNSSHNDPDGACLSLERRHLLVKWAEDNSVLILEDDWDAEYRYTEAPLPPLRAISNRDNVIYISNFWRTLYPLVNVSYMVVPTQLVPVLHRAWQLIHHAFHTHFPLIDELALITLIKDGHYEKHIRRTYSIYASRWKACLAELITHFGSALIVEADSSSYHVLIKLPVELDDEAIEGFAQKAGLPLISAKPHYMLVPPAGVFLLPFAHMSEVELASKLQSFAGYLKGTSKR